MSNSDYGKYGEYSRSKIARMLEEERVNKELKKAEESGDHNLQGKILTKHSKILKKGPPSYHSETGIIYFLDKEIQIPTDTKQSMVCDVDLKNSKTMSKLWDWSEIYEEAGERDPDIRLRRKIYDAGREINTKVALETQFKNFLIVTIKTTLLNPETLK